MGFNCGIVGLPNVGKSTLFNSLTKTAAADAANYPFCTIEPNTGRVAVPDPRLNQIAELAKSAEVIPTFLEFVDIAGLVRGAASGEGLGNQFLANIREVDAIIHVLRCFDDSDITHVENSVDPIRDAATVETELMLADMDSLERRMAALTKKTRGGDKLAAADLALMEKLFAGLSEGLPVRMVDRLTDAEALRLTQFQLLTAKPVLYACNVAEHDSATGNTLSAKVAEKAEEEGAAYVVVSAAIEAEIATLSDEEAAEFISDMGLKEPGLNRLIRAGYDLLDLLTFFPAGPKETRAWTVRNPATAPMAAGVIHTDFERGFIRAEVYTLDDLEHYKSEKEIRQAGKLRVEGKNYIMQDGDICHFLFNV